MKTNLKDRIRRKKYYYAHRRRCINYTKKWRNNNFEKYKAQARQGHLRRTFNISPESYERIYKIQNGACAICKTQSLDGKLLDIDHNHISGSIRGLLCRRCNTGLGAFKDNFIILEEAATYLKNHRVLDLLPGLREKT